MTFSLLSYLTHHSFLDPKSLKKIDVAVYNRLQIFLSLFTWNSVVKDSYTFIKTAPNALNNLNLLSKY